MTVRDGCGLGRWLILAAMVSALDCGPSPGHESEFLVRVGPHTITAREFQQAYELTQTAYPGSADAPALLQDARSRLLDELSVELVVRARAASVGVAISDAELDAAVAAIRADYPPGVFDQTLADIAVPYESWKQRVRARLLMDKLIAAELQPRVVITPEDVAAYYDAHYRGYTASPGSGERAQRLQEAIVADLGRRKLEEAFGDWIDTLKQTYPVEVNRALWARMTEPAAVPTPAGK